MALKTEKMFKVYQNYANFHNFLGHMVTEWLYQVRTLSVACTIALRYER